MGPFGLQDSQEDAAEAQKDSQEDAAEAQKGCSVCHSHPLYRTSFLLSAGAAGGGTERSNH